MFSSQLFKELVYNVIFKKFVKNIDIEYIKKLKTKNGKLKKQKKCI